MGPRGEGDIVRNHRSSRNRHWIGTLGHAEAECSWEVVADSSRATNVVRDSQDRSRLRRRIRRLSESLASSLARRERGTPSVSWQRTTGLPVDLVRAVSRSVSLLGLGRLSQDSTFGFLELFLIQGTLLTKFAQLRQLRSQILGAN